MGLNFLMEKFNEIDNFKFENSKFGDKEFLHRVFDEMLQSSGGRRQALSRLKIEKYTIVNSSICNLILELKSCLVCKKIS